jgi:hypothetical protein
MPWPVRKALDGRHLAAVTLTGLAASVRNPRSICEP